MTKTWLFVIAALLVIVMIVQGIIPLAARTSLASYSINQISEYLLENGYYAHANPGGLTQNRVIIAGASSTLTDDAGLTYNPTTGSLQVSGANVTRGATYVVAASNAPAHVKAQADFLCDGTADEVQINAANDAITASGNGTVKLSAGTFTLANAQSIQVSGNMTLEGSGYNSTFITMASGASGAPIIINDDTTNGNSNIRIRNLQIDGNESGCGDYTPGITLNNVTNGEISGCWVQNCEAGSGNNRGWGIGVVNSSRINIFNNYTTDNQHAGIRVTKNCYYIDIHDNFSWLNDAEGIAVSTETSTGNFSGEGNSYINIANNVLWGNSTLAAETVAAIGIEDKATLGNGNPMTHINITGNNINGDYAGISVYADADTGITHTDIAIIGNTINGTAGVSGIQMYNSENSVIDSNNISNTGGSGIFVARSRNSTISGNNVDTSAVNGIYIYSVNGTTISNNAVYNCTSNGINFSIAQDCNASNNVVIDNGASGMILTSATYCAFNNNLAKGNDSAGINLLNTCSDSEVSNNHIEADALQDGIIIQGTASYRVKLASNKVYVSGDASNGDGIDIASTANFTMISDNYLINTQASGTPYARGIRNQGDYSTIINNRILSTTTASGFYYGIQNAAGADNAIIANNNLQNFGSTTALLDSGTNVRTYNNKGWATENSGTTTILNGSTSIAVAHGLAVTPDEEKIRVVALENPTNAVTYGVSANATATHFWIFSDDPGASNLDLGWSYSDYP